ncbi:BCSC C-terminal domain-containing protein [Luteimonas sp. XNQY3]|nr:cellulose biosynthesis protein BcsC [Luteimonas sp. XNQY3]MCD9006570.1 BCSC C-terminal domain-containing protein [Luteimonas sp. XNQY3]
MHNRTLRRLSLVAALELGLLALPAQAQVDPTRQLAEQGRYWYEQGRGDLAAEAWKRLLATDPNQPDALLGLGLIDAGEGRAAEARARLAQLQRAHPTARQTRELRNALDGSTPTADAALRSARAAAAAGRQDEAVRYYEALLGGDAPEGPVALEYYQALAGTQAGWARGRDGLRQLLAQAPDNRQIALALAQVLTYRESGRREGVAMLERLAAEPALATRARAAQRQALVWLEAAPADAALYRAFLRVQPDAADVAARLAELEARPAQGGGPDARIGAAFRALESGALANAERGFLDVLRSAPNTVDALGGLGSVRMRQQRFDEAYEVLERAAARDARWRQPRDTARYWQLLRQAEGARSRGDLTTGLEAARRAVQLRPNEAAGHAELGALSANAPDVAEGHFKRALALDPDNAGALQGLVAVYAAQGRGSEASALFDRLSAAQREAAGGQGALRASVQRARALQAIDAGDLETAQSELEAALVDRPADPWIRLDLARLYSRLGRPDHARSVMDSVLAMPGDDPETLLVGALFAQESGDWQTVLGNLERIPVGSRSADAERLREEAWIALQARDAVALRDRGRVAEAQQQLRQAEATLGERASDPGVLAALAGAYADIGDTPRALTLARRLVADAPDTDARLLYAGVLLRAHQDAELSAVLRQLGGQSRNAGQDLRYRGLVTGYTLRQADALREIGNLEGAYDAIAPLLVDGAHDPDVLAALARMYDAAGDHTQALGLYRRVLQQRPSDPGLLTAAASSAARGRDLDTAESLLARALQVAPDSPEVLVAAGRVYRDAGQRRRAERYFQAALAAQERAATTSMRGLAVANDPRGTSAPAGSFNPFAGMTGSVATRPFASSPARTMALPALPALPAASSGLADAAPLPPALPGPGATAMAAPAPALPAPVASSAGGIGPLVLAAPGQAPAAPSAARISTGNPVLDELRALRAENSSSLQAGAVFRARDGESGLGRLSELQVPLLAEIATGEGRLSARLTPTLLDAGEVGTDYAMASRFGAGPDAALADALAGDRTPVDTLLQADIYRLMLTDGDTAATRELLYDQAVASGTFQRLFNETDPALSFAARNELARAALYALPVPAYVLDRELATLPIGTIAGELLADPATGADLSDGDRARLQGLAQGAAATLTAAQLGQRLDGLVAQGAAARRIPLDDSGLGVSIGYRQGGFHADLGTTPVGLQERNVVGGAGYAGRIGEHFTYGVEASRRAVTDSLLSFGGVQDPRSGVAWGGVAATGARLSTTLDNGLVGGYANLGLARLEGRNVADNEHQQLDLGVYVHAVETDDHSLTAGLNLTAMRYEHNLSGFTFGHGGYFSPQSYFDLGFPVRWSGRAANRRVNWSLDASVGVQHFTTDDSPYFPTDGGLQQLAYDAASLAALLGVSPTYAEPVYTGSTRTGASYNITGAAEWQLAPQLFLGGRTVFNNARDYRQFTLNAYLRFVLDPVGASLGTRPRVLASPFEPGSD